MLARLPPLKEPQLFSRMVVARTSIRIASPQPSHCVVRIERQAVQARVQSWGEAWRVRKAWAVLLGRAEGRQCWGVVRLCRSGCLPSRQRSGS